MSQKIEGGPPPTAVRSTGPSSGQVARAGAERARPVEASPPADSLRLTGEAAGLQALQRDLATGPAVDQGRVDAVREALQNGSYRIDPEAIASRMLDLDRQLDG
ncbi:flagellar biosynthesis anti-sigma factor FlgM [Luteimonas sp. RD2P54]|uniref:Negative regulator of flagellin synthesis n=1 Tax=Luteimonas endophytica TaxID=3042023 RepID=A0ABT6J816_9GAMM|nr:flagellar biosynthesis anti-sigma factor FlgM [Luteimonas endophytica]MDH5822740.1 flagellar biosynthesis anti-sigma factor FlgM [Luteimonas endophytica]